MPPLFRRVFGDLRLCAPFFPPKTFSCFQISVYSFPTNPLPNPRGSCHFPPRKRKNSSPRTNHDFFFFIETPRVLHDFLVWTPSLMGPPLGYGISLQFDVSLKKHVRLPFFHRPPLFLCPAAPPSTLTQTKAYPVSSPP